MADHSNIGASGCHRWWNCPGSVALCADLPPSIPSEYAKEGTAAHELADKCVKEQKDPRIFVGQTAANGVKWTKEMAKHILFYLRVVFEDSEKAGVNAEEVHFETKFQLKEIDENAFGTCDAYFGQPFGKLYVYDLKYGAGKIVPAENNLQLMYYALGALQYLDDITEVEMVIVQPRTDEQVKRWCVPIERFRLFKTDLQGAVLRVRSPHAYLLEGDWCKWCPALATCPKVAKKVVEVAQQDFAAQSPLPDPGALTPAQLKLVLDKAELVEDWLTAVESYAKSLLESGATIEGWKLVPKRAHRKWKDEFEVETALAEQGDAIYDKKLKTPKQMEDVVGKEKVAELSETPDNGLTLAKDEDKRVEAKSDFGVIIEHKTKKERKNGKQNKKGSDADFQSVFSGGVSSEIK